MMTKIRDLMARREAGEKGFTLVELLVVIIIIGILAAVAIPIFMNQQKSAVDAAVMSDMRSVATNVQTGLIGDNHATRFRMSDRSDWINYVDEDVIVRDTNEDGKMWVQVGSLTPLEVPVSEGTQFRIMAGPNPGDFVLRAHSSGSDTYTKDSPLVYNSWQGGFQN